MAALGSLLLRCGANAGGSPQQSGLATEARSGKSRQSAPSISPGDGQALAAGHNAFALDLYALLRGDAGNLFFSPYSIAQALTMASAGARGQTAAQIEHALHSPFPQERLHPAANALDLTLNSRAAGEESFQLQVANSVWGQRDYTFRSEFLDILATNYGAGLRLLDFASAPGTARTTINAAIAEQTQDKIKDLLPPGSISELTRLVLANAIYFNAKWVSPFTKELTADAPFTTNTGAQVTVPMMRLRKIVEYAESPDYQAVALPYKGGVSMIVFLPSAGALSSFEERLSVERLQAILGELKESDLILRLPKFMYQSQSVSLRQAFTRLGMADAFIPGTADFSGMDGTRNLYLHDVYHKAIVRVDENGTEAAAATGMVLEAVSAPPEMLVDRPFVFVIREDVTGALLFVGRIVNPKSPA
jgi:serpin B